MNIDLSDIKVNKYESIDRKNQNEDYDKNKYHDSINSYMNGKDFNENMT